MLRSRWSRLLAALLTLWLGVFLADPDALHACPVHSPVAAQAHGHAGHHDMGRDMGHDMGHDAHHAGHACSCPGPCCAAATTPLPAVSLELVLGAPVVVARPGRPEHEYVAAWVDFVLPYATAPPSALV